MNMKSSLVLLLTLVCFICSPASSYAAGTGASKAGVFSGKITAVNMKAHTITVTHKKSGQTRTISARHATISVNKQKHKHLADLKVGMSAKVKPGKKGHVHISAKTKSGKKKKKSAA